MLGDAGAYELTRTVCLYGILGSRYRALRGLLSSSKEKTHSCSSVNSPSVAFGD